MITWTMLSKISYKEKSHKKKKWNKNNNNNNNRNLSTLEIERSIGSNSSGYKEHANYPSRLRKVS